jgi:hypothetical protein
MSETADRVDEEAKRRLLLPAHHRRIEAMFEEVRQKVRCDDLAELRACWDRVERELDEHMCAEEEYLLAAFAEVDPVEARAIREEHDEIRRSVGELGVTLDLHAMRADEADRLIERLRAHAAREDRALYVWAAAHLPRWQDALKPVSAHPTHAWEELHRLLDETRLRLHLAGMEARTTFERIQHETTRLGRDARMRSRFVAKPLLAELRELASAI